MPKTDWAIIVISFIVGLLVSFFSLLTYNKSGLFFINREIGLEINPFELVSLLVNIILAVYLARTIGKKNDSEKSEKDLLINYLKDFKTDLVVSVSKLLLQENFESSTTNSSFKILRKKLDTILSLATEYSFVQTTDQTAVALRKNVTDIWELFTDVPRMPDGDSSTAVREDVGRLRIEKITKIEMELIEAEQQIFRLVLRVNRKM